MIQSSKDIVSSSNSKPPIPFQFGFAIYILVVFCGPVISGFGVNCADIYGEDPSAIQIPQTDFDLCKQYQDLWKAGTGTTGSGMGFVIASLCLMMVLYIG